MTPILKRILLGGNSLVNQILAAFMARVSANGGTTEATSCVTTKLQDIDTKSLLQSATFALIPSGIKAGTVFAELPNNGNGDLTFTRTTAATNGVTRVNSGSVIENVPPNTPRIDYSQGGCPNLLLEPQRVNYALNSDTGTTQTITGLTIGRVYTLSFYGTGNIVYSVGATGTLTGTGAFPTRVSVTLTMAATSILLTVTGTVTYLQFEGTGSANPASYATSYIPTTSGAATRNAESFTRNNIYTNGLIGASGGTWFVELKNNVALTRDQFSQSIGLGNSGALVNAFYLVGQGSSSKFTIRKLVATAENTLYVSTATNCKLVFIWDGSVMSIYENGVKMVLLNNTGGDGKATSFTPTNMDSFFGGANDVPKYISQMALWNTPLSDAQCIAFTS